MRRQILEAVAHDQTLPAQAIDYLAIMDQRPQRVDRLVLPRGFFCQLQGPPHAKAKPGFFCLDNLHRTAPPRTGQVWRPRTSQTKPLQVS